MNSVTLLGNLGSDPDIRQTGSGTKVANFRLATNEGRDRTSWHNVVAFEKTADIVEKFTRKGSKVCVEGRIQYREWEDKDGNKRVSTEIVVGRLHLVDKKEDNGGGYGGGYGS